MLLLGEQIERTTAYPRPMTYNLYECTIMEDKVRILALERENPNVSPEEFTPMLDDEARKVWELYQEQVIREMHFRADQTLAVLMLECSDVEEARHRLSELPLVSAGLIEFDYVSLIPYPGFSRLFAA